MSVFEFGLVGQWIQLSEKIHPTCGLYLEWKHNFNGNDTNSTKSNNNNDDNNNNNNNDDDDDDDDEGTSRPLQHSSFSFARSKHITEGDGEFDLRGKIDPLVHILKL
jgi:hypothetical protein